MRNTSFFSLLKSITKIKDLVSLTTDDFVGLCDIATLSGIPKLIAECQKVGKKPIVGCQFYLNSLRTNTITYVCASTKHWKNIVDLFNVSAANCSPGENTPYISIDMFLDYADNDAIIIDGYEGSILSSLSDEDAAKHICRMKDKFGENYYLEYNVFDSESERLLSLVDEANIVPYTASYFPKKDSIRDYKFVTAMYQKKPISKIDPPIEMRPWNYIKDLKLLEQMYDADIIENYKRLVNGIEDISSVFAYKNRLPRFLETRQQEDEMLRQLCREGWRRKIIGTPKEKNEEYISRIKYELDVISRAGLAGYFLIVHDYVTKFRQSCIVGPGRGSVGGSLISYLLDITLVDPIEYDLLFERFYNEGRNTADHVSLPDIDVDFPKSVRDDVITYLKNRYEDVYQIITFSKLYGKSIIREILRVYQACPFSKITEITECIPPEHKISDILEQTDHKSTIMWALENNYQEISNFCRLSDDGTLEGEYKEYFEQALRLENIYKSASVHAAGVIISDDISIVPIARDRKAEKSILAFEAPDLEEMGFCKFDVLGLSTLDKIQDCLNDIGEIE